METSGDGKMSDMAFHIAMIAVVGALFVGLATGVVTVVRKPPLCADGYVEVKPWLGKNYCVTGYRP
jgi:hypothetical protein